MEIKDPENKVGEFLDKADTQSAISLEELIGRMEEDEKKQGRIEKYFSNKSAFGYNWWYLIWHPWVIVREVHGEIKMAWQRAIRGWDDSQTWDISISVSTFLVNLLVYYKEKNKGIPVDVIAEVYEEETGKEYIFGEEVEEITNKADERWNLIIDEMIDGFKAYLEGEESVEEVDDVEYRLGNSLYLFKEYFRNLWW